MPEKRFLLVSHHGTIVYEDPRSLQLRHRSAQEAPPNLVLEIDGRTARLVANRPGGAGIDGLGPVLRPQGGCDIESFDDGTIGIRLDGRYVSADGDGVVRNDRDWCREWERFRLVDADLLGKISILERSAWLCHRSGTIIRPSAPSSSGKAGPDAIPTFADLAGGGARLAPQWTYSFGPAEFSLLGRHSPVLVETSSPAEGRSFPSRIRIVDQHGNVNSFSRWKPLIYYSLYGGDSYYECLRVSLQSLERHAEFEGAIGLSCDRIPGDVLSFVPESLHDRLIFTEASRQVGWFNRYHLEHGLYDSYQPVLYVDIDVVFDAGIAGLLKGILLTDKICCATESEPLRHLAVMPCRDWPEYTGNFFGRYLFESEGSFPEALVLGNSGEIGFSDPARFKAVCAVVNEVAARLPPDRIRMYGDQPILNYVLHRLGVGDHSLIDRHRRITRDLASVPPEGRRGLVHFHLASGADDVTAKARMMSAYLDLLPD